MTTPDWISSAQERLLNEPAPATAVDAVIGVLNQMGQVVLLALDVLHSEDERPGPPAHKDPRTPKEHAENLLYAAHRLYFDGPGRQFIDAPDWMREVKQSVIRAKKSLGRPTEDDAVRVEITQETATLILSLLQTMRMTYDGEQLRYLLPQGIAAMEDALSGHDRGYM